jgi:hypothetical protein
VVYLGARYTLIPKFEDDGATVRLAITRRPVELVLGYAATSRIAPNAELSFIAEQNNRETLRAGAGLEPTPAVANWSVGLGPRIGVTLVPWPALSVVLRGGADLMLTRAAYVTDEKTALAPAAIRPRLDLELGIGVQ